VAVDVTRVVARALNGGDDDLMYQALELRGSPARGPESWWRDRLGLLKRVVFAPLRQRFRHPAAPMTGDVGAFDVTRGLGDYRRAFARRHFAEEIDFVGAQSEVLPKTGRGPWLRWYLLGIGAALLAFFDASERRYFWLGGMLLEIQAIARALPGLRRVYCFAMFDRRPYLVATFLARRTHVEVVPVFQNIPLYRNCRFLHLELPVVLTSAVNLPEVDYFRSRGWFRATEIVYRSQEFGAEVARAEPSVDIGFFSSGEWARADGLYQSRDVEAVRAGEFGDNPYARKAQWLVETLADYAREAGRSLRIYPHPYERRLWTEHGIEPPYAHLSDGERVTIDRSGEHSREKMFEPRAAVSLQSSFIWERLDLGLDASFIFEFQDREMNAYLRESLGRYAANVFADDAELRRHLDAAFGRG